MALWYLKKSDNWNIFAPEVKRTPNVQDETQCPCVGDRGQEQLGETVWEKEHSVALPATASSAGLGVHVAQALPAFSAERPIDSATAWASNFLDSGIPIITPLKYERLQRFCTICCGLGHDALTCKARLQVLRDISPTTPPDLRGYLLRSIEPKLSNVVMTASNSANYQWGPANSHWGAAASSTFPTNRASKNKEPTARNNTNLYYASQSLANYRLNPKVSQQVCDPLYIANLNNVQGDLILRHDKLPICLDEEMMDAFDMWARRCNASWVENVEGSAEELVDVGNLFQCVPIGV